MSTRIVILTVLDPRGECGLTLDAQTARDQGVEVVPIATGLLVRDDDNRPHIQKLPARHVAKALQEVSGVPVDGMLIGLVPGYFQARAVANALANWLPETLVYAPSSTALDSTSFLGVRNRRLQMATILPEATVAVLPLDHAPGVLGRAGKLDASAAASAMLERGAHAAWLIGRTDYGRGVDTVATEGKVGLLDYPLASDGSAGAAVPGALAAMLALGRPLQDSINAAHRYDTLSGTSRPLAVAR